MLLSAAARPHFVIRIASCRLHAGRVHGRVLRRQLELSQKRRQHPIQQLRRITCHSGAALRDPLEEEPRTFSPGVGGYYFEYIVQKRRRCPDCSLIKNENRFGTSPRGSHSRCDTLYGQPQQIAQAFGFRSRLHLAVAFSTQEFDLNQVQGVDVGVTDFDRTL